jgi:diaminopimelate decarboxylase
MNIDVLQEATPLPALSAGDALVIHPAGAYNLTQSMQFITYRPRVVMVMENGSVAVIRERENLAHIESLERLPPQLAENKPLSPPPNLPPFALTATAASHGKAGR